VYSHVMAPDEADPDAVQALLVWSRCGLDDA
jgi:hypothetical protein